MNLPTRPSGVQSYQTVLYNKALHPELFSLKGRRVVAHGDYELEAWIMAGCHLLRFERTGLCLSELVTDQEDGLPDSGVVSTFQCAGERDFEHDFKKDGVNYMTTVQTETLSENVYLSTLREMRALVTESGCLAHAWNDAAGPCLSLIDTQRFKREVHAQCYHLVASGGFVLRTQSIFEHE